MAAPVAPMRVTLAAVGRMPTDRGNPERALFETYAKRLKWPLDVREVEYGKKRKGGTLKSREAELLRGVVPAGAKRIALDERGKALHSRDFAEMLGAWRDDGVRDIAFLIGGAVGLDESLRRESDLVLNFGNLTWPHMLARVMLAEQLYRAYSILSGHPYHRD